MSKKKPFCFKFASNQTFIYFFKTKTSTERNEKRIDVDNKKLLHAIFLAAKITTDENAKLGPLLNLNIPKINAVFKTHVLGKQVNDPDEYLKYFSIFSVLSSEQFTEAKHLFNDFYGHFHNSTFESKYENVFKNLGTEYRNKIQEPRRFLGTPNLSNLLSMMKSSEDTTERPEREERPERFLLRDQRPERIYRPERFERPDERPESFLQLESVEPKQDLPAMQKNLIETEKSVEKMYSEIAEIKEESLEHVNQIKIELDKKLRETTEEFQLQQEKIREESLKTQTKIREAVRYEQHKAYEERMEFKKLFKTTKDYDMAKKNLYKNAINVALGKTPELPIFSESTKWYKYTKLKTNKKEYSENPKH